MYVDLSKPFVAPEEAEWMSDKCPQVMSHVSVSVGSEDHKFENEKNLGLWMKSAHQTSVARSSSLLQGPGDVSRY